MGWQGWGLVFTEVKGVDGVTTGVPTGVGEELIFMAGKSLSERVRKMPDSAAREWGIPKGLEWFLGDPDDPDLVRGAVVTPEGAAKLAGWGVPALREGEFMLLGFCV